jgi:excisionase family DNA binding protein
MNLVTTPDHQREYLTVAEVAAELACSEPTVRRRIREGELPAVRLGPPGSGLRIPRAVLTAWLWSPNRNNQETDDAASGEDTES